MITSSILFNGGSTSGTFLGIRTDPICRFRVVFTFLKPFLDERAETRLMILESTAKAKGVTAAASDGGDDMI